MSADTDMGTRTATRTHTPTAAKLSQLTLSPPRISHRASGSDTVTDKTEAPWGGGGRGAGGSPALSAPRVVLASGKVALLPRHGSPSASLSFKDETIYIWIGNREGLASGELFPYAE